ncbi:hypothetical protein QJS83_13085 [Bdellovibrio sp. 22V]|uniref:DUF6635 family protein n=1 Tax=Bdellovibrio TaxID=958 RepID=UPI0025431E25|nr:DUF6635 family protein [Bdellovibrio sp. 22V]WII71397.1 hypothetical protein QJS83_13085 [Bdellovibrio sp. 22V]
MTEQNKALALGALDECISQYCDERRQAVDTFIERHFSLQESIDLQKKHFLADLLLNPLNALWSIPYLTLKKLIETSDKMGWTKPTPFLEKIPSGFKTRYQKEIENLIYRELLDADKEGALWRKLNDSPALQGYLDRNEFMVRDLIQLEVRKEIEKYSSSQTMISDLASSLATLGTGWIFFGDKSLSIGGLGDRIARKFARDKAASNFFLGEKLGKSFYGFFPPQPSRKDIYIATFIVGLGLTVVSLIVTTMSDPLRKRLGLHRKKLLSMIDGLEERLFLQLKKEIKSVKAA